MTITSHHVTFTACLGVLSIIAIYRILRHLKHTKRVNRIPKDLDLWRSFSDEHFDLWSLLSSSLEDRGYCLWKENAVHRVGIQGAPDNFVNQLGFAFFSNRDQKIRVVRQNFNVCWTNLVRTARASNGSDVVLRVVRVCKSDTEHRHLDILRKVAQGPATQDPMNHTLPLLDVFDVDGVGIIAMPILSRNVSDMFEWKSSTVEDAIHLILQMLEAAVFLHSEGIAHQDLFSDNFVAEWMPESRSYIAAKRPRVYVIDLEAAVHFENSVEPARRLVPRHPFCFPSWDDYGRKLAPEIADPDHAPYCPFALDIWQLGFSLRSYQTLIPDIDHALRDMLSPTPEYRPGARQLYDRIQRTFRKYPPADFDDRNLVVEREWDCQA